MRTKRYVHLEETEIMTLREGHKNGQQYQFRNRCHCLLLSHEGHDMATLKTIFDVSHPTIMNWFNGGETNGIRGVVNQPGQGRKSILSANDQPLIKTKLQATPQQLKRVRHELKAEPNKDFSTKTLTRLLKSLVRPDGVAGEKV